VTSDGRRERDDARDEVVEVVDPFVVLGCSDAEEMEAEEPCTLRNACELALA
jgi:hypothetical protein